MTYLSQEKRYLKRTLISKDRIKFAFLLVWAFIFIPALFRGMPVWAKTFFVMSGISAGTITTFKNDLHEDDTVQRMYRGIINVESAVIKDRMGQISDITLMEQENKFERDKIGIQLKELKEILSIPDIPTELRVMLLEKSGLEDFARALVSSPTPAQLPESKEVRPPLEDLTIHFREEVERRKLAGEVDLPYGLKLSPISVLNDITKFATVIISVPQGYGKTGTICAIMNELDGYKAISTPKPLELPARPVYDLIFGFDRATAEWAYTGKLDDVALKDRSRDLTWYHKKAQDDHLCKFAGSVMECVHAAFQESSNRQAKNKNGEPWHVFLDEASQFYLNGGVNLDIPLKDQKAYDNNFKVWVSQRNKCSFMNYRSQKIQVFYASQTKTLDSLGLDGFGETVGQTWRLIPGKAAISECRKNNFPYPMLEEWLTERMKSGYAIAILIDGNNEVIVLDMPLLSIVESYTDKKDIPPDDSQYRLDTPPIKVDQAILDGTKEGLPDFVEWCSKQSKDVRDQQIIEACDKFLGLKADPTLARYFRNQYISNLFTIDDSEEDENEIEGDDYEED